MQTSNKRSLTCLSVPRNAGIFDSLSLSTLILFQGKGVQNPIRLTKVLLYSLKSPFAMKGTYSFYRETGGISCASR